MTYSFLHLNWLAILGTTVIGFLLGWLWYSPLMFSKAWMAEMKMTEEQMKEIARQGMARHLAMGFLYTFIATVGLATLIRAHIPINWMRGAQFGAFVGALVVGARMCNAGVWEQRSVKLSAIKVGYEIVLFTVQGIVLTLWW